MVSEWGGMTFLLPYVLFVILIASTGVIGMQIPIDRIVMV